jgi:uncharacterized protein (DUF2235 family)
VERNIVFCADGTWNGPGQDQDKDGSPDHTNVYKLFLALDGEDPAGVFKSAAEQEKEFRANGSAQIAKYIHGVGDSKNPVKKLIEGTTGTGTLSRIVRGYTFVSRNYEPGANIFIVGFSRGAYTARALAGLIASQGLLGPRITQDKELAYRCGKEAWYRYRATSETKRSLGARVLEALASPREFFTRDKLKDADLIPVDRIASVAVWDTVGAMGLPRYHDETRRDEFKFANTRLSEKVSHGFHAVALDERRVDFTPTLWDATRNVTQVLFPGAHSDVGGGYPDGDGESGLANGALQWMIEQLQGAGVRFVPDEVARLKPDPTGTAHQPWRHGPWPKMPQSSRVFPAGMRAHASIEERMRAAGVVAEPGEAPGPYRPDNRP